MGGPLCSQNQQLSFSVQSCESYSKSTLIFFYHAVVVVVVGRHMKPVHTQYFNIWSDCLLLLLLLLTTCSALALVCSPPTHPSALAFVVVGYYFSSSLSLGQICYQAHQALVDR